MYKKYKDYYNDVGRDIIKSKVLPIINFEEDDTEYSVDEFEVSI